MRWLVAIAVASLAGTAFSCGDDSVTNGAADAGSQNARCCPVDPAPGCCVHYGGWSAFGDCSVTCDGMRAPSAERHRLGKGQGHPRLRPVDECLAREGRAVPSATRCERA